jgi:hypothetical protein
MKLTDELLKQALQEIDTMELADLPNDEDINHVFSKRFERNMKKMIYHERQSPFQRKWIYYGKRAAMFILVLAAVMFTTVMSVSALRTQFFAMISNAYQRYSEIHFKPTQSQISSKTAHEFERYEVHYLPVGYRVTNDYSDEDLKINDIEFENSDQERINFHQEDVSTSEFNVNTEGVKLQDILISGEKAFYYENKGMHTIVWHNDDYAFLLSADATAKLDKNEMIRIAESVAPKK